MFRKPGGSIVTSSRFCCKQQDFPHQIMTRDGISPSLEADQAFAPGCGSGIVPVAMRRSARDHLTEGQRELRAP